MKKRSEQKEETKEEKIGRQKKEKLYVKVTGKKVRKRNLLTRILMITIIFLLLFLSIVYAVLYIVNETGNFTVSLDPNLKSKKEIHISKYKDFREEEMVLKAPALEYMDNITMSWLPADIDGEHEGAHNGKDYLAYTFYVKNGGEESAEYETRIEITSVIKNVDEAIRVIVYKNGEKQVYAKRNKNTLEPEPNTKEFISNYQVMYEKVENFQPGSVDKYTVVIYLEGEDPECIDDILGGEMKLKMYIHESEDTT